MEDINIDFDNLMVGQVIKGLPDPYPHLGQVGDKGNLRDKTGRIRANATTIKIYRDPYTNEVKKKDIKITRVYSKDTEYLEESEEE